MFYVYIGALEMPRMMMMMMMTSVIKEIHLKKSHPLQGHTGSSEVQNKDGSIGYL